MATNYDDIADQYHTIKINPIKKYSEEFTLFQHLGDISGLTILDLACGDGYYSRLFCEAGAKQVLGVDLSEQMIDRANELERASEQPVSYMVGNVAELSLHKQFDLVTAVYLLQYAANETILKEMFETAYRHLQPNARFVTITGNPNLTPAHIEAQKAYGVHIEMGSWQDGATIHNTIHSPEGSVTFQNHHWTQATYERLLKDIGFQDIQWPSMQINPQGMQQYGDAFWQPYQDHPAIVMLSARRKV